MLERVIATCCLVVDQLIFLNHSQNRLCASIVRQSLATDQSANLEPTLGSRLSAA